MRRLDAAGYDTDKDEGYLSRYEALFGGLRDQPVRLLELGVLRAGSLLLWRDYFPKGTIVGLDVDPVSVEDPTGRIRIFQGGQEDRDLLDRIASEFGPFDIVIDDAAHIGEFARISFWHLFRRHVKPGGLYVIEDWGTGYWDAWTDGHAYESEVAPRRIERGAFPRSGGGHTHGMVGFVKELVDECGMADVTKPDLGIAPHRSSLIERLQISHGQVTVFKAGRRTPAPTPRSRVRRVGSRLAGVMRSRRRGR